MITESLSLQSHSPWNLSVRAGMLNPTVPSIIPLCGSLTPVQAAFIPLSIINGAKSALHRVSSYDKPAATYKYLHSTGLVCVCRSVRHASNTWSEKSRTLCVCGCTLSRALIRDDKTQQEYCFVNNTNQDGSKTAPTPNNHKSLLGCVCVCARMKKERCRRERSVSDRESDLAGVNESTLPRCLSASKQTSKRKVKRRETL